MMESLTPQERRVLFFVCLVLGLGLIFSYVKKTAGCRTCSFALADKRSRVSLDLNTATREGLLSLPLVGPKAADDIIAYRASNAGFKDMEELDKIAGLSESVRKVLKEYGHI